MYIIENWKPNLKKELRHASDTFVYKVGLPGKTRTPFQIKAGKISCKPFRCNPQVCFVFKFLEKLQT